MFWSGVNGQFLYVWPAGYQLKQFAWDSNTAAFQTTASAQNGTSSPWQGGILALSANGSSNGILWASQPYQNSANHATVAGLLHAYDATNVSKELWNSYQNKSRDDFGNFAKFCPPTIANGKVYMATFSNLLAVYGLLSTTDTQPPSAPTGLKVTGTTSSTVSLAWSASTDNVGVAGYDVYRTTQGNTTLAGQTSTATLAFTDKNLNANTNYSYSAKAFDQAGNLSPASNSVKAKTTK